MFLSPGSIHPSKEEAIAIRTAMTRQKRELCMLTEITCKLLCGRKEIPKLRSDCAYSECAQTASLPINLLGSA